MRLNQIFEKYRSLSYVDISSHFSETTMADFRVWYYPNKSIKAYVIDFYSSPYSEENIEKLADYIGKPQHFSLVGQNHKDLCIIYDEGSDPVLQGNKLNSATKEYIGGLISKGLQPHNIAEIYSNLVSDNFGIRVQKDNMDLIISRHEQDNSLSFKQDNGFSSREFEKFFHSYLKSKPIDYQLNDFRGLSESANEH